MKQISTIKLGYMDKVCDQHVKELTDVKLEELMRSERVCQIMHELEAAEGEEEKNRLKQQLPVALYACQMPEDGKRPCAKDGNVVASGLCLHDFDHMTEHVRTVYWEKIAGREEALGVMLAHVSPRGRGLRLVTVMQPGESVDACQVRMARELGMEAERDRSVKDLTRLSFIPSWDYLLYMNKEMFRMNEDEMPSATKRPAAYEDANEGVGVEDVKTEVAMAVVKGAGGLGKPMAELFKYEGISYGRIIGELLKRIATGGEPREGERNGDLYQLVRELRHTTDYQFDMTYMLVQPYFEDLPDQEIRRTINSALGSTGRTMTPCMKGILKQLHGELNAQETKEQEYPKMPKLPPLMEMVVKKFPKHIQPQVALCMLPILGVYGTHVRFRYLDNRVNSLSFMTAVVGKSGHGKAFANHLYQMLTPILNAWDVEERQKDQEFQLKMDRRKTDEEYPEDPRAKVRLFADDITTCMMLEYLDNLDGEHALQFTEEAARLVKARKSHYADNDDLYCKAFDNAVAGKESKNRQTRNIRTQIFLNTLFCGTPDAMHNLYNNPEGGLNNRVIFCFLPAKRPKGIPRYEDLTQEERRLVDGQLMLLWRAGTKEKEENVEITDDRLVHQGTQEMKFAFLDKAFTRYIEECDREDEENPDEAWRDMANRASVVGYRAGVLAWLLWGRPTDTKSLLLVKKFALWVAAMARLGVYNFSGEEYEEMCRSNRFQPKVRLTKNKRLLSDLPEDFTMDDLAAMRAERGDSVDQLEVVISRWVGEGLVMRLGDKRYRKLRKIA